MSTVSRLLVILCITLLLEDSSQADEVRLPATGIPALTFNVPDDWIVGEEKEGGIINIVDTIPASVAFTIALTIDAREPKEFITEEMSIAGGETPVRNGIVQIAGFKGEQFKSSGLSASKQSLAMDYLVARIDDHHLLAVTQITSPNTSARDMKLAEGIIQSMKVLMQ